MILSKVKKAKDIYPVSVKKYDYHVVKKCSYCSARLNDDATKGRCPFCGLLYEVK